MSKQQQQQFDMHNLPRSFSQEWRHRDMVVRSALWSPQAREDLLRLARTARATDEQLAEYNDIPLAMLKRWRKLHGIRRYVRGSQYSEEKIKKVLLALHADAETRPKRKPNFLEVARRHRIAHTTALRWWRESGQEHQWQLAQASPAPPISPKTAIPQEEAKVHKTDDLGGFMFAPELSKKLRETAQLPKRFRDWVVFWRIAVNATTQEEAGRRAYEALRDMDQPVTLLVHDGYGANAKTMIFRDHLQKPLTKEDWQTAVVDGETTLGYDDWVDWIRTNLENEK